MSIKVAARLSQATPGQTHDQIVEIGDGLAEEQRTRVGLVFMKEYIPPPNWSGHTRPRCAAGLSSDR